MLLCQDCFKQITQRNQPTPLPYFNNFQITHIGLTSYGLHASLLVHQPSIANDLTRYVNNGPFKYCYCTACGCGFHMEDEWPTLQN